MNSYTLEELAWFDRTLFPDDFYSDLVEAGMPELDARVISMWIKNELKKGRSVGIVNIYQEYITDPEYCNIFDKVVSNFLKK